MSGPKKADVEAALNIARTSQRRCAERIARVEQAALERLLKEADEVIKLARTAAAEQDRSLGTEASEIARTARATLTEAEAAIAQARQVLARARQGERDASQIFTQAEQEYHRAVATLEAGKGHYLQRELEWAHQARNLYDQAEAAFDRAAETRRAAQPAAVQALRWAWEARATLTEAGRRAENDRREAEAHRRAEKEVQRNDEQKRQAAEVAAAQRQQERMAVQAELAALEATVESMDADLILNWSDHPQALEEARAAVVAAREAVAQERFAGSVDRLRAGRQTLTAALDSAAENKRADEQRHQIGEAVMGALTELGFEVSFEQGSRTAPLRIAGQTPDPSGRGDFDLAIPLDGAVDFEVNTPAGDSTCVAAVEELRQRLAERGILWRTTDWGHASQPAAKVSQQGTQTTQRKRKEKW